MTKPRRLTAILLAALMLFAVMGSATTEEKQTIRINMQAGQGVEAAWKAVKEGYEALNPNVEVLIDLKPSDGYADWVKAQFASDETEADIIAINLVGPAMEASKGLNLFEYAYDISPYTGLEWHEQINFPMQVRNMALGTWTALSLQSVQVLWCYNSDIFNEVGVTPPKTWAEFLDVCEKIEAAGYQALAVAGDFDSFWAGQMGWLFQNYVDQTTRDQIQLIRAQEGDYCWDDEIDPYFVYDLNDPWMDDANKVTQNPLRYWKAFRDGEIRADSAGIKKVTENFSQMFPKYAGGDAFYGTDGGGALSMFMQGKAAILLDGGWRLTSFKRDMDDLKAGKEIMSNNEVIADAKIFEIGTFNMPSMEGEEFLAPARTIEVAVGFIGAAKKDKAHDDLIVDFLMYYTSPDGYGRYLAAGIADGMSINGPALVHGVQLPDDIATLFDGLSFIGNAQKGFGQALARGIADNQEALRAWYGYTMDYMNGKISIDTWGEMHQENQMAHFDDALIAARANPQDLDNPQNAPTGE